MGTHEQSPHHPCPHAADCLVGGVATYMTLSKKFTSDSQISNLKIDS